MKVKLLGLDQKQRAASRAKIFSHRNKIKNMKEQSILLIQGLVYQRSKLEELGKIPSFAKQSDGFLVAQTVRNLTTIQETGVWFLGWEIPWRREWKHTPVFLPGKFHGQRNVVGYNPWDSKELDTTEQASKGKYPILLNRIKPNMQKKIARRGCSVTSKPQLQATFLFIGH